MRFFTCQFSLSEKEINCNFFTVISLFCQLLFFLLQWYHKKDKITAFENDIILVHNVRSTSAVIPAGRHFTLRPDHISASYCAAPSQKQLKK